MRRTDREITDPNEIYRIICKCESCTLALFDTDYPYAVPLSFGADFDGERFTLYFHSAPEGKKSELMRRNPHVAFSMDCSHEIVTNDKACKSYMDFESVCGRGIITILNERDKAAALNILMKHYTGKSEHNFDEATIKRTTVIRLDVTEISGKRHKIMQ